MPIQFSQPAARRPHSAVLNYVFASLVVAGIIVLGFAGMQHLRPAAAPVTHAEEGPVDLSVFGRATFTPARSHSVVAQVSGTVISVAVTPGERVAAGQTLLTLANPTLDRDHENALSELASALSDHETLLAQLVQGENEAKLATLRAVNARKTAALQWEAEQKLQSRGVSGAIAVERVRLELEQKEAEEAFAAAHASALARSHAAQRYASEQRIGITRRRSEMAAAALLSRTIRAGADAVVASITESIGAHVAEGSVAAELISHELAASILVAEGAADAIPIGSPVSLRVAGRELVGVVSAVAARAENGTFEVRAALNADDVGTIRVNTSAEARISLGRAERAITIERPPGARPHSAGHVYAVDASQSAALRRSVTFGALAGSRIVVLNGVGAGEAIAMVDSTEESVRL
jgi:multidrug resistance efflux pump